MLKPGRLLGQRHAWPAAAPAHLWIIDGQSPQQHALDFGERRGARLDVSRRFERGLAQLSRRTAESMPSFCAASAANWSRASFSGIRRMWGSRKFIAFTFARRWRREGSPRALDQVVAWRRAPRNAAV